MAPALRLQGSVRLVRNVLNRSAPIRLYPVALCAAKALAKYGSYAALQGKPSRPARELLPVMEPQCGVLDPRSRRHGARRLRSTAVSGKKLLGSFCVSVRPMPDGI